MQVQGDIDDAGDIRRSGEASFGDYSFDFRRRELVHRGVVVRMEPRVRDLIGLLIRDAGRIISRHELRARLWPDGNGSDDALNYLVSRARQALSAGSGPLIATVRGRGYRFDPPGGDVVVDAESPPSPYDRSAELQGLRRLAASCVSSSSTRFALITGVAGIGKTCLVEQVSAEWRDRGLRSVSAACLEGADSPPLWPWQCLLREISAEQGPPQAGAGARPLTVADRFAYFVDVRQWLDEVARRGPVLVALENLHLADDATLTLLQFLTHSVRPAPILFVATARTPLVPPGGQAVGGLARNGQVLSLGPIGKQASLRLFRSVLGKVGFPELETEALRLAHGNPLFVRELAFRLRTCPDRAFEILKSAEPSAIRESIRWHVSTLDLRTQELLRAAANLGEEFDARRLANTVGIDVSRVLADLSVPIRQDVVRPLSAFDHAFCNTLFHRYLRDAIPNVEH